MEDARHLNGRVLHKSAHARAVQVDVLVPNLAVAVRGQKEEWQQRVAYIRILQNYGATCPKTDQIVGDSSPLLSAKPCR